MRFVFITLSFLLFIFIVSPAQAHFRGQPFVKINGIPTKIYTQNEFASIGDISVPSDLAPGKYLPNTEIKFEIDVSVLPFPEEVTKEAKYKWDFGDGTKIEGDKVSHIFKKPGPYVVNTEIEYGDLSAFGINDPSELPPTYQLILINVLPNSEYKVPNPKILIDGQNIERFKRKIEATNSAFQINPPSMLELYDHVFGIRIAKDFTFDASKSTGSSKIKEYLWDFGSDKLVKSSMAKYSFTNGYYINDAALRIKDENGFYSDVFFEIGNKDMDERKDGEERDESPILTYNLIYTVGAGNIIVLGIIIFISWHFFMKKKLKKEEAQDSK